VRPTLPGCAAKGVNGRPEAAIMWLHGEPLQSSAFPTIVPSLMGLPSASVTPVNWIVWSYPETIPASFA
jgi:hypothetical protein